MRFGDVFYKIGVYYTHYQCLGHTARINTLLKNFRKQLLNSDLYLFQGSAPQTYLKLPDYVKIFNLPYPLFSKDSFKQPLKVNNHFSQLRSAYSLELIKKYDLDIFLTEYFPLGRNICKGELLPILYFLKKNNKIIVSSAGYPVISEKSIEDINLFSKFYNKIYIHSPQIEKDYLVTSYKSKKEKNKYLDLFKKLAKKVVFTGYILTEQLKFYDNNDINFKKNKINILVNRGAGAYYPNIIKAAIKASDLFDTDFYFTIIAGPATSKDEWKEFKNLLERKKIKNAVLKKYSHCLTKLIKESDLSISTASYNTAAYLLYYRKKAVVIPFQGYGNSHYKEQPSRARLLADFIGSSIIYYPRLDQTKLKKEILRQIQKNKSESYNVPKEWFKGIHNFFKDIKGSGLK